MLKKTPYERALECSDKLRDGLRGRPSPRGDLFNDHLFHRTIANCIKDALSSELDHLTEACQILKGEIAQLRRESYHQTYNDQTNFRSLGEAAKDVVGKLERRISEKVQ